jgi:hypothetical protein
MQSAMRIYETLLGEAQSMDRSYTDWGKALFAMSKRGAAGSGNSINTLGRGDANAFAAAAAAGGPGGAGGFKRRQQQQTLEKSESLVGRITSETFSELAQFISDPELNIGSEIRSNVDHIYAQWQVRIEPTPESVVQSIYVKEPLQSKYLDFLKQVWYDYATAYVCVIALPYDWLKWAEDKHGWRVDGGSGGGGGGARWRLTAHRLENFELPMRHIRLIEGDVEFVHEADTGTTRAYFIPRSEATVKMAHRNWRFAVFVNPDLYTYNNNSSPTGVGLAQDLVQAIREWKQLLLLRAISVGTDIDNARPMFLLENNFEKQVDVNSTLDSRARQVEGAHRLACQYQDDRMQVFAYTNTIPAAHAAQLAPFLLAASSIKDRSTRLLDPENVAEIQARGAKATQSYGADIGQLSLDTIEALRLDGCNASTVRLQALGQHSAMAQWGTRFTHVMRGERPTRAIEESLKRLLVIKRSLFGGLLGLLDSNAYSEMVVPPTSAAAAASSSSSLLAHLAPSPVRYPSVSSAIASLTQRQAHSMRCRILNGIDRLCREIHQEASWMGDFIFLVEMRAKLAKFARDLGILQALRQYLLSQQQQQQQQQQQRQEEATAAATENQKKGNSKDEQRDVNDSSKSASTLSSSSSTSSGNVQSQDRIGSSATPQVEQGIPPSSEALSHYVLATAINSKYYPSRAMELLEVLKTDETARVLQQCATGLQRLTVACEHALLNSTQVGIQIGFEQPITIEQAQALAAQQQKGKQPARKPKAAETRLREPSAPTAEREADKKDDKTSK